MNVLAMIRRLFILFLCAAPFLASAQERPAAQPEAAATPAEAANPPKPRIEKLDATRYRIGKVILDQQSREIRFPAKVEMTDGLLEFLFVLQQGKIHETLFITDVIPTHLNLAFTLLRYQASNELISLKDEAGHMTGRYPDVPILVQARSRMYIDVEWKDADGKVCRVPVNEWIIHSEKSTVMPPGPWVYSGSDASGGKYIPDVTGDIAAIFTTEYAMINYPGKDHDTDLVWFANAAKIPPQGTEVTIIITPLIKPRPKPVEPAATNP